ncbi:MAG: tRNA adenosine(34) deaminase TadA [Turicibacter sp.]|nr:tRNA adenosine(34) deaminase TadA [Turicibacter sp.]
MSSLFDMKPNLSHADFDEDRALYYMKEAYAEALIALELDEVPIGCVIVFDDRIIGRGHNLKVLKKNPLFHAEIIAINQAAEHMRDWRLEGCNLYVTVEPCSMCAGAIVQARMSTVIYGAKSPKAGCAGSILNILEEPRFNHIVKVVSGVYEEECAALVTAFFKTLRDGKRLEQGIS